MSFQILWLFLAVLCGSGLASGSELVDQPAGYSSVLVHFLLDESGSVSNREIYSGEGVVHIGPEHSGPTAGHTNNNVALRGFLSFSLLQIPSNAAIKSANMIIQDISCLGDPFSDLGSLKFEAIHYGSTLTPEDYDKIGYLTLLETNEEPSNIDATEAVKEAISRGYDRFQVRFFFRGGTDEYDEPGDMFGIDDAILEVVYSDAS